MSKLGFKIGSTAIIWGFATGMLAICIPLVSMTNSGIILPLAVIIAAAISTLAVWLSIGIESSSKVNPDG
jgi:hypothetical protein